MVRVILQCALTTALTGLAVLAPPAHGAMLAVPLGATPAHSLLRQDGVGLVGAGPLPGSLVIDAAAIPFGFAVAHKILLVRGGAGLCSEGRVNAGL